MNGEIKDKDSFIKTNVNPHTNATMSRAVSLNFINHLHITYKKVSAYTKKGKKIKFMAWVLL